MASRKFLTGINLGQNQLEQAVIQKATSAPVSPAPVQGQVYFNTTDGKIYTYDGAAWDGYAVSGSIVDADIAAGAAIANSKLATNPLARANHTGTQAANTISDFNSAVQSNTLNSLAVPTGSVSLNSQKITNLATPTLDTDAATKGYVDASRAGLDVKDSVRAATTAAGTLASSFANGSVVDGVTLATGNRILIKDQAAGSENGIYSVNATGAPTRTADADTSADVTAGMFTFVSEGTVNADSGWVLATNDTITLGTTALTFAQFSGAGSITAGNGLTKTGNSIDAVGTTNRITVSADAIDISTSYVGQTSITTLGTIATGTWNGTTIGVANGGTGATTLTGYVKGSGTTALTASTTIPGSDVSGNITGNAANVTGTVAIANGGTGATTAGAARTALGATAKYSVTNATLTPSSNVVTWTVTAATHGLGATGAIIVQVKEVATGAVVEVDITINDSTGEITLSWSSITTVTAGTYRITAIG